MIIKGGNTMARIISIMIILLFSFFQVSICSAYEQLAKSKFLERMEKELLGEKTGTLDVDSEPQGALVFVDGVLKGKTPCSLSGISPGKFTVQAQLDEYAPQEKEVEVTAGETQVLKFVLERASLGAATGVKLTADPANSCIKGATVTFTAEGSGGTGKYEYRFSKKGPSKDDRWIEMQKYSSQNTWAWKTTDADVGSNRIVVHVRSTGSTARRQARNRISYEVKEPPNPDRQALEELLTELEQKIEDGDKRMIAHPTFLDELRDLLKRYKNRIAQ
jgi:hypothetical protein